MFVIICRGIDIIFHFLIEKDMFSPCYHILKIMLLNYTFYIKKLRHNIENVIPNICEESKNMTLLETRFPASLRNDIKVKFKIL